MISGRAILERACESDTAAGETKSVRQTTRWGIHNRRDDTTTSLCFEADGTLGIAIASIGQAVGVSDEESSSSQSAVGTTCRPGPSIVRTGLRVRSTTPPLEGTQVLFCEARQACALPKPLRNGPKRPSGQAIAGLVDSPLPMSAKEKRVITTKVFRAGEIPPEDDWTGSSAAERIDAVWELTRQCLAWNQTGTDEPRLQRSVSRVQRPQR
jgi:hypothetical protein